MKYYIIAGEASGDLHGSNLMKGLFEKDPKADVRFWGGPFMNDVSQAYRPGVAAMVKDYKDTAVMGFKEVLLKARTISANLKFCMQDILSWQPDVIILIDYPGFNLKIAEFAHNHGLKVFWYIAPKVWASREGRIRKIKKFVDKLFIVFPFEKEYFDKKGISYVYCGNPLIDAVDNNAHLPAPEAACGKPYIALLAGSRKGEVKYMMPVFKQFADILSATPGYEDYKFLVAGAPSRSMEDYALWAGPDSKLQVIFGQTQNIVRHAKAAVVNSGTASLETAIVGTPQVVVYATSALNAAIAKRIIKIDCVSLGNLIAGRKVFKELLQYYFTPENVVNEVIRLTSDQEYIQTMKDGYQEIRTLLGGRGASQKVASAIIAELIVPKKEISRLAVLARNDRKGRSK
ncbi:MAG: lipid-A-disaccharide synthase [Bacteroidales bacterium]|nr:lipid-A-disaccharide synthase [Bacteroidales bacterium]